MPIMSARFSRVIASSGRILQPYSNTNAPKSVNLRTQSDIERSSSSCFSTLNGLRFCKNADAPVSEPPTPESRQSPSAEAANSTDAVIIERIEHLHIMAIGINRPKKRNCVNEETANKLRDAFEEFEADENSRVAILHGIGGNFCAGYDLEELASLDKDELSNLIAGTMLSNAGPMGPTRMHFSKPVIAAINGWCVGGGLELALMCDLRVAETSSQFGVLNRRFGVPLIDGGSVRLPELIGLSRAMDLILTGRIVEAEEAFQIGLVNRLAKPGTSYGCAMHLAKELIAHPQQCLRVDRASAIFATYSAKSLEHALQNEGEQALSVMSIESIQGAKKFASGLGRHGKFNISPVMEPLDWQKEHQAMADEDTEKKKSEADTQTTSTEKK